MITRYMTAEMKQVWSSENRFKAWFMVELAVLKTMEKHGQIPAGISEVVEKRSKQIDWNALAKRQEELEQTTKHDVIAFLSALEEWIGKESCYLHFGMTSSDVLDTSFAMLLSQAGLYIQKRLLRLRSIVYERALEERDTVCLGRTHGQYAEITTFGLKLLSFVAELDRGMQRLESAMEGVSVGKIAGAVGNYGNIEPYIEADALLSLGIKPEKVSTQVVCRDRHGFFFSVLALIGGTLERMATEIRHLQRSEVQEVLEPFSKGQKGSSAMPHKRNPILSENVTGLVRLLRSYAQASLENQALWHERDIAHSSVERVIAPDATAILDFALERMIGVMQGLEIRKERMMELVEKAGPMVFSESILLQIVRKGVLRQAAYGWVQRAALKPGDFITNLKQDQELANWLTNEEIESCFCIQNHLEHVGVIFKRFEPSL